MDHAPCRPEPTPERPLYRFVVRSRHRLLFRLTADGVGERDELIGVFKDRFPAPEYSVAVEQASWQPLGGW